MGQQGTFSADRGKVSASSPVAWPLRNPKLVAIGLIVAFKVWFLVTHVSGAERTGLVRLSVIVAIGLVAWFGAKYLKSRI